MKKTCFCVTHTICVWVIATSVLNAAPIQEKEREDITRAQKRWWGGELEWRFDKLPATGSVEKKRIPYAGHIYPDNVGGCELVLRKYDRAFYPGKSLAVDFERKDIAIHRTPIYVTRRGGFRGRRTYTVRTYGTPHWAGHCNGWTAAAIRHAEPQLNVTRNGVVFTPSDIKGLLAELYIYCDTEMLGGAYEYAVNPATFHVVLTNWIGLGGHPVGMDNTLGKEIWNYPIYSYKSSSTKYGDRQVEVTMNIGFVNSTDREYDQAPKRFNFLYLHYYLDLDEDGKIVGGGYYRDSNQLDLLWAPLQPTPGGSDGNKQGNPHLDVKEVLAIWRDSVPGEARADWYNINPWPKDAIVDQDEEKADVETVLKEGEPERAVVREAAGLAEAAPAEASASESQIESPAAETEADNPDE